MRLDRIKILKIMFPKVSLIASMSTKMHEINSR